VRVNGTNPSMVMQKFYSQLLSVNKHDLNFISAHYPSHTTLASWRHIYWDNLKDQNKKMRKQRCPIRDTQHFIIADCPLLIV
jgi:hypothetical protein